jgi:hypothetical protein
VPLDDDETLDFHGLTGYPGFGLPYPVDPGDSYVITSPGNEDPAISGFSNTVQGNDRGDGWDLSVVNCEVVRYAD